MTETYRKLMLHRMGYYGDQEGILRRYRNEGTNWSHHLEQSRQMILRAVEIFNPQSIVVLGSGWLLDLPLKELTEQQHRITLIDLILQPEIKKEIDRYPGVSFIRSDITGGLIENVYKNTRRRPWRNRVDIDQILACQSYKLPEDADLVVSLNILNQLDSLPAEYLRKKTLVQEDEIQIIRQHVQQQHIDMLSGHNALLISDFCEHPAGDEDKTHSRPTVATRLPEGFIREEWDWVFDTRKSYNSDSTTVFRVAGILIRG